MVDGGWEVFDWELSLEPGSREVEIMQGGSYCDDACQDSDLQVPQIINESYVKYPTGDFQYFSPYDFEWSGPVRSEEIYGFMVLMNVNIV